MESGWDSEGKVMIESRRKALMSVEAVQRIINTKDEDLKQHEGFFMCYLSKDENACWTTCMGKFGEEDIQRFGKEFGKHMAMIRDRIVRFKLR